MMEPRRQFCLAPFEFQLSLQLFHRLDSLLSTVKHTNTTLILTHYIRGSV